ncbi:MAG: hypothetical protein M0P99_01515 [Candidatus Cloacimonetes bacterium]|nr:hypothetical protein [Candidatus Cloacimonadota bacterium]
MKSEECSPAEERCLFRVAGKQVHIDYQGHEFSVFLSTGMGYLLELLCHPELPVSFRQMELANARPQDCYRQFENHEALLEYNLHLEDKPLPNPMADKQTLHSVKARLLCIIEELAELAEYNDYARAEDLNSEKEALVLYLREVYRPGNKIRDFEDEANLQKRRILKALRRAIADIANQEPNLASHLSASISVSEFMVYRPDCLEIGISRVPICVKPKSAYNVI